MHLSSKQEYQSRDATVRMAKELYSNLHQLEKEGDLDKMPYYACETQIQLNIDDLFAV